MATPIVKRMSTALHTIKASASHQINAVVVSSGLMNKTVKVRVGVQKWNKHIQKVCSQSLVYLILTFNEYNISYGRWERWKYILTLPRPQDFNHTSHLLVHDPASSLRTGDIISISPGWRVSKNVHHVVKHIIAPFGEPIEARPPVPTEEERLEMRIVKRRAKVNRRNEERGFKVDERWKVLDKLRERRVEGKEESAKWGSEIGGLGGRMKFWGMWWVDIYPLSWDGRSANPLLLNEWDEIL
jgi:small subunit ribosomal protein S17